MKRNTIAKTLTIAAVTVLALGVAPTAKADDKGCSNVLMQGTFAYTGTGSINPPSPAAGPFVEVGTQTFDGKGGTTFAATASQNGNIRQMTGTGTYTVNPDCTGTMTLQVSPTRAVQIFFVIADGGNEFHAIETDPGLVITRIARRLFPGRAI
ncbi:MAG: hypothetical protein LAQ69_04805 [Acidobacteriia bacterium]|nr:hypothetical protein [Terriglobia bacterium]